MAPQLTHSGPDSPPPVGEASVTVVEPGWSGGARQEATLDPDLLDPIAGEPVKPNLVVEPSMQDPGRFQVKVQDARGEEPLLAKSATRDLAHEVAGFLSNREVDPSNAATVANAYLNLRELCTKEFLLAHRIDQAEGRGGADGSEALEAMRSSLKQVQLDIALQRSQLAHIPVVHGPRMAVLSSGVEMKQLPTAETLKRLLLSAALALSVGSGLGAAEDGRAHRQTEAQAFVNAVTGTEPEPFGTEKPTSHEEMARAIAARTQAVQDYREATGKKPVETPSNRSNSNVVLLLAVAAVALGAKPLGSLADAFERKVRECDAVRAQRLAKRMKEDEDARQAQRTEAP